MGKYLCRLAVNKKKIYSDIQIFKLIITIINIEWNL